MKKRLALSTDAKSVCVSPEKYSLCPRIRECAKRPPKEKRLYGAHETFCVKCGIPHGGDKRTFSPLGGNRLLGRENSPPREIPRAPKGGISPQKAQFLFPDPRGHIPGPHLLRISQGFSSPQLWVPVPLLTPQIVGLTWDPEPIANQRWGNQGLF